uniref:Uncharacterized protein n=1 Tax=Arundo donax TaxID=35708 RepID=A0A0A9HMP9_ARUDO
MSSSPNTLLVK